MNSFYFLKIFKNRSHIEKNDLRVYNRQFRAISMKLHSVEQINEFIVCRWYLQNLLEFTHAKIIKKHFVDLFKFEILNFAIFYNTMIVMQEISVIMRKLKSTRQTVENLSAMTNEFANNQFSAQNLSKKNAFAFFVMNTFFMTAQRTNSVVENLTKTMKNLKINFVRDLSENEIFRIIKQKNQTRVYLIEFYISFSSFAFSIEIVSTITHVYINAIDDQKFNYQ